jgi:hypothetical protein
VILSEENEGPCLLPVKLFLQATLGLEEPEFDEKCKEWPTVLELEALPPLVRRDDGVVYVERSQAKNFLEAPADATRGHKGLRWLLHLGAGR